MKLSKLGLLTLLLAICVCHELEDTPYTEWIHQVAGQFNRFRTNTDNLLDYHWNHQYANRWIESRYQCWDDMDVLEVRGYENCMKKGMWKEDAETKWGDFEEDVYNLQNMTGELDGLQWSDELALSAGWYMEDISGCNVWQPNIIHDQPANHYLKQIAEYDFHHRVVFYPERFEWRDTAELIWDLFMDDDKFTDMNLATYLSPEVTQIGVACNCHPTFNQFCVIELGSKVKALEEVDHTHEIIPFKTASGLMPFWHTHEYEIPQLKLPGDPRCEFEVQSQACNEIENSYDSVDDFNETPPTQVGIYDAMQNFTYDLFNTINQLRDDPISFQSTLGNRYARHELRRWDLNTTLPAFRWNRALSNAARHVANDEGACETYGDVNGNFIPEVLLRYYAYDYSDLEILKVTSIDMAFEKDPKESIEYILAQDCISKNIFKTQNREFGIGCACSANQKYSCYFVSANKVVGKEIIEKIPAYQPIIDYNNGERCQSYCPYKDMQTVDTIGPDQHQNAFFFADNNICPEGSYVFKDSKGEDSLCQFCTDRWHTSSERCQSDISIDTQGLSPNEDKGLYECEGHYGVFRGHTWRSTQNIRVLGRRRDLVGWGSDELRRYGNDSLFEWEDYQTCDYPDCSYFSREEGCLQCFRDEDVSVIDGNPVVFSPMAKYLWNGECHIDCESIEGEFLTNFEGEFDSKCVCNENSYELDNGKCLPCSQIDEMCDTCELNDDGEPVCLTCRSQFLVPSPDLDECWNKLGACAIPLEFQTWEFWNEDPKGMRLRDGGKYSCDECVKGYFWQAPEEAGEQGRCTRCPEHCLECHSDQRCITCRNGYIFSPHEDRCVKPLENCSTDPTGYQIWSFEDFDVDLDDHPEDIEDFENTWRCPECRYGFTLNEEGECQSCSDKYDSNCDTCNSEVCLTCSGTMIPTPSGQECQALISDCDSNPDEYVAGYELLPVEQSEDN